MCGGTTSPVANSPTELVYPRVCGGTIKSLASWYQLSGLSPRVRGNLLADVGEVGLGGSISACAGEPTSSPASSGYTWVYPRVCGEPAQRPVRRATVQVYPRVCGGTSIADFRARFPEGLSPRVRGNRNVHAKLGPHDGSIPACAGEPVVRVRMYAPHSVYPRVCGGTPNRVHYVAEGHRSIPACAGEPLRGKLLYWMTPVYPRVCGGTLVGSRIPPHAAGSIPACAGEPEASTSRREGARVYPRVCGGTAKVGASKVILTGLSPRVRGEPVPGFPVILQ